MVPAFASPPLAHSGCEWCGKVIKWPAARVQHEKHCRPRASAHAQLALSSSQIGSHASAVSVSGIVRRRVKWGPDTNPGRPRKGAPSRKRRSWEEHANILHLLQQCEMGIIDTDGLTAYQFVCDTTGVKKGTLSGFIARSETIFDRAKEKKLMRLKGLPVGMKARGRFPIAEAALFATHGAAEAGGQDRAQVVVGGGEEDGTTPLRGEGGHLQGVAQVASPMVQAF